MQVLEVERRCVKAHDYEINLILRKTTQSRSLLISPFVLTSPPAKVKVGDSCVCNQLANEDSV